MKKRVLCLGLAILALLLLAGCRSNESSPSASSNQPTSSNQSAAKVNPEVTVKIGHLYNEDHAMAHSMQWLADRLMEVSEGRIEAIVYPNGSLTASDKEGIENTQSGVQDIGYSTATWVKQYGGDKLAALGITEIPYLFDTVWDEYDFMDNSDYGKAITRQIYEQLGVGVVGTVFQNTNCIALKKPAAAPGDLNGRKLRATGTTNNSLFVESLGASAIGMATTETFSALQQGMIDGTFTNIGTYYTGKWYEVAPNLLILDTKLNYTFCLYNLDFYNRLSDENKAVVDQVFAEWNDIARNNTENSNAETVEACKEICESVVYPEGAEKEAWVGLILNSWSGPIDDMGYDNFAAAMEAMGRDIPEQYALAN